MLNHESDIEVVAEAESGQQAVEQAIELAPDVVLMDVRMPGGGGIEAARAIKSACPSASILMLTISDEEDDLYEAIKAGATGYLLKEVSVATVADALRKVTQGESFLSPTMASKLLSEFSALSQVKSPQSQALASGAALTPREKDVLGHVARGESNREIAKVLEISENTVKNHVRNILEKLHLHDRMEAALFAAKSNLVDATDRSKGGQ